MTSNSIKAIVKFNNSVGLVLEKPIEYSYKRYGNIIIGTDSTGIFHKVYQKDWCPGGGAFGGRTFHLEMENGEVIHDEKATWWSAGHKEAEKILGFSLCSAVYNDLDNLKDCYVFTGDCANQIKLEELNSAYTGRLYGYWEYDARINPSKRSFRRYYLDEIKSDDYWLWRKKLNPSSKIRKRLIVKQIVKELAEENK